MLGIGCRHPVSEAAVAVVGAFERSDPVDASVVVAAGAAVEAGTSVQTVVAAVSGQEVVPAPAEHFVRLGRHTHPVSVGVPPPVLGQHFFIGCG